MTAPIDFQTRLALTYVPSTYQAGIFDWIESGRGHAVVEAVAGSGKTTTIVSAAKLLQGDGLFVAFNKSIADMLAQKLAGSTMRASTVHSHGFAALRFAYRDVRVDGSKYKPMIRSLEDEAVEQKSLLGRALTKLEREAVDECGFPAHAIAKLLDLARLDLINEESSEFGDLLLGLAAHHDLDFDEDLDGIVVESVRRLMQAGKGNPTVCDFTDMVWLPIALRLRPKTYAWVFVDEAQDLSRAALRLITKSVRRGGRMLFVGDPNQAIYGFAGADADAWERIIEETEATILPLSVCYRCPTSVLDRARALCPQIEARPGAPEGIVRSTNREEFVKEAREGDMVLCRRNAPLLGLCFQLIAAGVSAAVRGRDIGAGLVAIVEKVGRKCRRFEDFSAKLSEWAAAKLAVAAKRFANDEDKRNAAVDAITDQVECIRVIQDRSGARGPKGLITAIEELFGDDHPSVTLSSVHKAKGLEAGRVFLAEPDRLASPRGTGWQLQQERNLAYVAYTRAERELIDIIDPKK
jgi:DNA helicase-2/ATP-dependent DNA helicase PcrA